MNLWFNLMGGLSAAAVSRVPVKKIKKESRAVVSDIRMLSSGLNMYF